MKHFLYFFALMLAFALGAFVSRSWTAQGSSAERSVAPVDPPAYLIAVGTRLKPPEALSEYRKAAGPLAMAAGYQLLATQPSKESVKVLEGQWPHEGFVTLEKFTSMKDLLGFWNSDGYQAAKKLRADAIKMDYIIAIEAPRQ